MPDFATFNDLNRFKLTINEASIIKSARTASVGKTVFLAHSSKDAQYLPAVISVLQNEGGNVYVDKADQRLPQNPNRETAEILRGTIKTCRRFVMFVTPNSKDSKWVPWELGLADGEKGEYPVALFPAATTKGDQLWAKQEYLQLYSVIVWGKINDVTTKPTWIVWNRAKNTAVTLRRWLNGG